MILFLLYHNQPLFECKDIHEKWGGSCGCEEEFKRSVEKYKEAENNN